MYLLQHGNYLTCQSLGNFFSLINFEEYVNVWNFIKNVFIYKKIRTKQKHQPLTLLVPTFWLVVFAFCSMSNFQNVWLPNISSAGWNGEKYLRSENLQQDRLLKTI